MYIRNELGQIDDIEEFDYEYWLNLDEKDSYRDQKVYGKLKFANHESQISGDCITYHISELK